MRYTENERDSYGESMLLKAAKQGSDALKQASYLPRQMLHGSQSADQLFRINNGAKNYEYQYLGSVSPAQVASLLGLEKMGDVEVSEILLARL